MSPVEIPVGLIVGTLGVCILVFLAAVQFMAAPTKADTEYQQYLEHLERLEAQHKRADEAAAAATATPEKKPCGHSNLIICAGPKCQNIQFTVGAEVVIEVTPTEFIYRGTPVPHDAEEGKRAYDAFVAWAMPLMAGR